MTTLFITGATGFIGHHLLSSIEPNNYKRIFCLSRTEKKNIAPLPSSDKIIRLYGDILNPETYSDKLSQSDIVIHLAAITGKAKPDDYFKVNTKGTKILVDQCKKLGVKKFLYVSSIAANFKNRDNYPYAKSKMDAEQIVKANGIPFTILRPTIVIGNSSPILASFIKLAKYPISIIFGDGTAIIQPIHVEDLIACILYIIRNNMFHRQMYELGGPEKISIQDFIKRLREINKGKPLKAMHIPIGPVAWVLELFEKRFISLLPITAGQLASFSNDGTIRNNILFNRFASDMKRIDEMIKLSLPLVEKNATFPLALERECERFVLYLTGLKPDKYIKKKYIEGHIAVDFVNNRTAFNTLLVKMAMCSTLFTKIADVYTCIFFKNSVFRRKLVLLLAILESCPNSCALIDSVSEISRPSVYANLVVKTFLFFVFLLISIILFGPIHAVSCFPFRHLRKN